MAHLSTQQMEHSLKILKQLSNAHGNGKKESIQLLCEYMDLNILGSFIIDDTNASMNEYHRLHSSFFEEKFVDNQIFQAVSKLRGFGRYFWNLLNTMDVGVPSPGEFQRIIIFDENQSDNFDFHWDEDDDHLFENNDDID